MGGCVCVFNWQFQIPIILILHVYHNPLTEFFSIQGGGSCLPGIFFFFIFSFSFSFHFFFFFFFPLFSFFSFSFSFSFSFLLQVAVSPPKAVLNIPRMSPIFL